MYDNLAVTVSSAKGIEGEGSSLMTGSTAPTMRRVMTFS